MEAIGRLDENPGAAGVLFLPGICFSRKGRLLLDLIPGRIQNDPTAK